jgi:hypothetical protein
MRSAAVPAARARRITARAHPQTRRRAMQRRGAHADAPPSDPAARRTYYFTGGGGVATSAANCQVPSTFRVHTRT